MRGPPRCALLLLLAAAALVPAARAQGAAAPAPSAGAAFVPRDDILLDCGATGKGNDTDGRQWDGDAGSKYAPPNLASASAGAQDPSVPQVPYLTARVSAAPFTYSFPLGPGRKFLRLHFYPANYSNRDAADAFFSVSVPAAKVTLLSNFSAYQTITALNFAYLVREFSVNVTGQNLDLTFTPEKGRPNAYAFVNGIEVVSSPDLFDLATPLFVTGDGNNQPFPMDPAAALQTMYRLNVGGQSISPSKDSGGARSWDDDTPYIYGAGAGVSYQNDPNVTITYPDNVPGYVAPSDVYATARSMGPDKGVNLAYNLTWILQVDAGYQYLVRLHFCEIQSPFTKPNQRVFSIYLNNQTAMKGADVILWADPNGIGTPVYKDYVVSTVGSGTLDFWVALHPDVETKPQYYDAILNGMEVFKLQLTNGSLVGLNPLPSPDPPVNSGSGNKKSIVAPIVGGVVGGLAVLALGYCCFICKRRRKAAKASGMSDGHSGWLPLSLYGHSHTSSSAKSHATGSYASSLPSNLCRHFSFAEIKAATKNFDESRILGVGGFGKVYHGEIDGGTTKLRHRHLVSLIGYCEEKNEMILVYDYMAHGTLREHLYKTQNAPLSWRQRLEICIGAARGLHYLHTGAKHTIIHRDVKTTNILLDEKWVAKVSDFGLSKTGPSMDHTHVSTVVKGSFGYLDPEYFRRQQLTEKSDVYSFGVVLFEVLCARPALNPTLAKEEVSLAEWALHCQKKGILDQIVDPYLKGKIVPQCFKKFAETAEKCVADNGIERPSMGDVLWNLEFALQMQESAEESGSIGCGMSDEGTPLVMVGKKDPNDPSIDSSTTTTTTTSLSMGDQSVASIDSDGLTPSAVFSQIMNPKGR
ncbi:Receptor-like protein kinase FERONIA [Hordeum vulgare]|nr:Receptor-like protein kinase FERONIA [Hordeum vulgare]